MGKVQLSMRQLVLAALGATGSLLMDLTAFAQLSTDTSTFSGQIAANCSFSGLNESTRMDYHAEGNHIFGMNDFSIATNVPLVRLGISSVSAVDEPTIPSGTSIVVETALHHMESGRWGMVASSSKSTSSTRNPIDYSQNTNLRVTSLVHTRNQNNNHISMVPGSYSYSVTISCLL